MGFLSRKKPKPASVEIEEQHPIVDELKQMEEAVPERPVDEAPRAAGPVSDESSAPAGADDSSSPPAAETPVIHEQPTVSVAEEPEDEGVKQHWDGRAVYRVVLKAVKLASKGEVKYTIHVADPR